jgi:hypothetical protein
VPRAARIGPSTRGFTAFSELYANPTNCVAERERFELSVLVCVLDDVCASSFQIVFGELHLRRILKTYASYYNDVRTYPCYYLSERGADLRLIQSYLGYREVRHTTCYVQLSPRRFEGLFDD